MNIVLSVAALAIIIVLGVVTFRRRFPYQLRLLAAVLFWTLMLARSLAPVTIAAIPVPFAVILGIGIFAAVMNEVLDLVTLFRTWHLVSFPTTAFVVYLIARKVLSNSTSSRRATSARRSR